MTEPNSNPRKPFLVRKNCEYSVMVDAKDPDEALAMAEGLDPTQWEEAWSPLDAEEQE